MYKLGRLTIDSTRLKGGDTMKNNWEDPQVFQLGVEDTKGGTVYNPTADGDPWQDSNGKWHIPVGRS